MRRVVTRPGARGLQSLQAFAESADAAGPVLDAAHGALEIWYHAPTRGKRSPGRGPPGGQVSRGPAPGKVGAMGDSFKS
ncbi:hypothetical protein RGQ21_71470 [Kitasatospora aureofaciens]|nr:hypothetical protein RGQ21_71470 [Kitasatospora aureofaciens]